MATYKNTHPSREISSVTHCIKYLLFTMNFLFFAIGCAGLALGIWFLLEKNYMSYIVDSSLMTAAAWMIIIGSAAIAIISFFGCVGAIGHVKVLLILYFVVILIVFLGLVTGGILALVFRSELGEEVKAVMRRSLQDHYGVDLDDKYNRAITDSWDTAQEKLYCCSVEDQSWEAYRNSKWYRAQLGDIGYNFDSENKKLVPKSCCTKNVYGSYENLKKCQYHRSGPPNRQSPERNEGLNYLGCYNAGKDFIYEYTGYMAAIGIGVGLLMILGMAFAIILYVKLPN